MGRITGMFLGLLWICQMASGQTLNHTILGGSGSEDIASIVGGFDDGSVCVAGTTNSSTDAGQYAWMARIDSLGEVMWQQQVSLGSGFTAHAVASAGGSPYMLVLASTVYDGLPEAYDLHWWRLDPATGMVIGDWAVPETGWQIVEDVEVLSNGQIWTAYQDYGNATPAAAIRRISILTGFSWYDTLSTGPGETWVQLASDVDGEWIAGLTAVEGTESNPFGEGKLRLWNNEGDELWSATLPLDSSSWASCAVSPEGILVLGTRTSSIGQRQVVARYNLMGDLTLQMQMFGSADVVGRAIGWLNESDFVTLLNAEFLGFGGGESAVMVYNQFGNWQGGLPIGTPGRDEAGEVWVEPLTGVVWGAGRSNGYGAGDWDGWVFRSNENPLQNPTETVVYWNEGDWVMATDGDLLPASRTTLLPVPHPVSVNQSPSHIQGLILHEPFRLLNGAGHVVFEGLWPEFQSLGVLAPGLYWLWQGRRSGPYLVH